MKKKGKITYRFRLYPTEEQSMMINKTIGCVRLIYNKMLEDKIEHYVISIT